MNIAEMLSNIVEGSFFFYNLKVGEMKLEVQVFFSVTVLCTELAVWAEIPVSWNY